MRHARRPRALGLSAAMVLVVAWVIVAFAEAPASAQPPDSIETVLDEPSFQTELPFKTSPPSGSGESHREWPRRSAGGADLPVDDVDPGLSMPTLSQGSAVVRAFFWVLLAAAAVVLVMAFAGGLGRRRRDRLRIDDDDVFTWRAPESARGPEPDEIDALVGAGRYAEAVHLLLVRGLVRLDTRRGVSTPKSFTSREILRRSGLADGERQVLKTLVETVERSLFGGRPVTCDDYERCAAAFGSLTGSRA